MSLVLFICLAVLLVYLVITKYRLFKLGSKFAGPWSVPLIGNVQMIKSLNPEYLFLTITENRRKYGRSFRLWLGTQLWVFLHTPEETRDALNDPTLLKAETFNQLNVLIGNGLLISHGKFWENHRRVLGPAFHPNILNSFTPAITQHAAVFLEKLRNTQEQPIEVTAFLFSCILDTIVDTSMGKQLNSQQDPDNIYALAFHNASKLLFQRMVNPLLSIDIIYQLTIRRRRLEWSLRVIHDLVESVIYERVKFLRNTKAQENSNATKMLDDEYMGKRRQTLLDTLLTATIDGKLLTSQEIRDEVNTFVFAGVDTTTAAMSFVLYSLAKYPTMQSRILQEINENMEPFEAPTTSTTSSSSSSTTQPLTSLTINRLEYLDMFIKEVLRFYTIVPLTGRQTTCATKIGNIEYCAGATVWINMHGLAHDETVFENPDEFRPERFDTAAQQQLPAFSYLPFSGGPHVCIGRKYALMMMKLLTVQIVQNFEVCLRDPQEELVLMSQMVLKSLHGINLIFKPRV